MGSPPSFIRLRLFSSFSTSTISISSRIRFVITAPIMRLFYIRWKRVGDYGSGANGFSSGRSFKPLLRNRKYLLLVAAQLVSNMGEWLYFIALLTLVGLKWQATPWEITAMTLCMAIPIMIGGPIAGMLGDRYERKKIMIVSDVVRAALLVGMIFAGNLIQIYILLVAKGLMDVLFSPAKSGKIKEIVDPKYMDQAVTISSTIEQTSKIIGHR